MDEKKLELTIRRLETKFGQKVNKNKELYLELVTSKFLNDTKRYINLCTNKINDKIEIMEEVLTSKCPNSDYKWLGDALLGELLEHFIRFYIQKHEGSQCSGDKTNFCINRLIKCMETGRPQSLYEGRNGTRNYWSPNKWENTDELLDDYQIWYSMEDDPNV